MTSGWIARAWAALRGVLLTAAFCIAVAALLAVLGLASGFGTLLVISLCIGLSLHALSELLVPRFARIGGWVVGSAVVAVSGIGLGVALAGVFVDGNPLLFFSRDYQTLIISVFFGALGLFLFTTRENLLEARAELAEARAANELAVRRALETELRLLQAQIEPHFLFNTLGNVVSLVRSDPARAEATLLNLARLLRTSLQRTRSAVGTLGDELELVTAYLEIQQVRMGERLRWTVDVPPGLRTLAFPPMLLQPLVENAVLHGVEPKIEGGTVAISARCAAGMLCVDVTDTGAGLDAIGSSGGIGLANVRERLEALYGRSADLDVTGTPDGGVSAALRLPLSG